MKRKKKEIEKRMGIERTKDNKDQTRILSFIHNKSCIMLFHANLVGLSINFI